MLVDALRKGIQVETHAIGDRANHFILDEYEAALNGRRPLVRACVDWTERRPHVAGALGAALLRAMLDSGWVQRRPDGRALNVTPAGREALFS